ncbi:hypothetical protein [Streptomyces sp. NBC_00347]|nr:hypothetical protein [Streptomyces sp. NBC_00347]MCX5126810.1 hypothetical protein [Streptomyces sp. NBC_00347]
MEIPRHHRPSLREQDVANGSPWDYLGSDAETDLVRDDFGPIA